MHVEEPAQRNTTSLTNSSRAGNAGDPWTQGGLHLGNRRKSRRDLDNHALPAGCQALVLKVNHSYSLVRLRLADVYK